MPPAINTDFTITIEAAAGRLIVTLQFPVGTDREVVQACMGDIACALHAVEPLSDADLQGLYWREQQLSEQEHSVQLMRAFTDPEFPQKFDAAIKSIIPGGAGPALH